MKFYENRHAVMLLFCWLYIGLGCISFALGAYMMHLQRVLGSQALPGVQLIAGILMVFGPVRAINSARIIYRIQKPKSKARSRNSGSEGSGS
jgi:hypothetical protein